jgi:hypothetical protein
MAVNIAKLPELLRRRYGGETRWTSASNPSWADAVRQGMRVALAKCEAIFRLQEPDGETAPRFDFGGEAII